MSGKLKVSTVILIVVCIVGLCLLLYPSFSNYYNRTFATHAIVDYQKKIEEIKEEDFEDLWEEAKAYNADLASERVDFVIPEEMRARYKACLSLTEGGLIGYIEIPKIRQTLPIYHGTSDEVLQNAIGHLEWSSLPTGGIGTHCALSGHRGLVNAKLFSDLDMLREGEVFMLNILGETLTYEVDQIRTVNPNEMQDLVIDPEKDYCTLITCTPYGINTHRLLVRGHRVENAFNGANVISEAVLIDQEMVALCLAVPLLFVLCLVILFKKPKPKKQKITLQDFQNRKETEDRI